MIRYFISDLHLSDKRPDLIRAFIMMMNEISAKNSEAELYLLGDFYEAWIGDDFQSSWNTQIEEAIYKVSNSGINVFFLHGNRDFLIGDVWLNRVGAKLLNEQTPLCVNEFSILLSHGDEYCLEDTEYQKFRATVRSNAWQQHVLAMPIEQRLALAAQLRNDSQSMASDKSMEIMDVTVSATNESLIKYGCKSLIHGHTHRPSTHHENGYLRCVLGDWDSNVWLATVDGNTYRQGKATVELFLESGLNALSEVHKETLIS